MVHDVGEVTAIAFTEAGTFGANRRALSAISSNFMTKMRLRTNRRSSCSEQAMQTDDQ